MTMPRIPSGVIGLVSRVTTRRRPASVTTPDKPMIVGVRLRFGFRVRHANGHEHDDIKCVMSLKPSELPVLVRVLRSGAAAVGLPLFHTE